MTSDTAFGLDALVGLELTIARRAADMRVFHFGPARTIASRSKRSPGRQLVIGEFALHIQCPWRLDGPTGTVTGSGDLHVYAGPHPPPEGWTYDNGNSRDELQLDAVFGPLVPLGDDFHYASGVVVDRIIADATFGDLALHLSNDHVLNVFPNGSDGEEWRYFRVGDEASPHVVFGEDRLGC